MRSSTAGVLLCGLAMRCATTSAFPVCHICPKGDNKMSNPGGSLNTGLKTYKCGKAKEYGLNGELGTNSCKTLQMYANADISNPCGCSELATFPVANTNPICDVCPQRTVEVTINGNTYQSMSVHPDFIDTHVMTQMSYMTCGVLQFNGENQWLPMGTCASFQADAEKGGCCTLDKLENGAASTAPPVPSPSPKEPLGGSEKPSCGNSRAFCTSDNDTAGDNTSNDKCCAGLACIDQKCIVKSPPSKTQNKQKVSGGTQAWGDRKLLRKAKTKDDSESQNS